MGDVLPAPEFKIDEHLFAPRLMQSVTGRAHFAQHLRKHGFAIFRLEDRNDQVCVQAMRTCAEKLFALSGAGEHILFALHRLAFSVLLYGSGT